MANLVGLDVRMGQAVAIHAHGHLVATANRHGRCWSASVRSQPVEAVTLDELLVKLGVLPNHHRR